MELDQGHLPIQPLNNWALPGFDWNQINNFGTTEAKQRQLQSMLSEVPQAMEKLKLKIKQAKITKEKENTARINFSSAHPVQKILN